MVCPGNHLGREMHVPSGRTLGQTKYEPRKVIGQRKPRN